MDRDGVRSRNRSRREFVAAAVGVGVAGCVSSPRASRTEKSHESTATAGARTDRSDGPFPFDASVPHDRTAWSEFDPDWTPPEGPPPADGYAVEVLVENLDIPWDISFGPGGELFVTERTGRIVRVDADLETVAEPDEVIDAASVEPGSDENSWYVEGGEGGLLGIAVHPTYPDPPLVYVYATTETDAGRENRVLALELGEDGTATRSWTVVGGIPANAYHNGGRLEFGPANYLWVTTGDADPGLDDPERIADPGTLAGKILRVRPDGEPPGDNPDHGGDPRVYTYGHRNPQGISWLPDATPVITEHGPGGGDELSVLRPGANYGWPEARNGDEFEEYDRTDYQPPVADAPSWAPSGSLFYTGDAVPELRHRLLFGGLISQQIGVATIAPADREIAADAHDRSHDESWTDDEYRAATSGLFEDVLGRVRHLEQGPEGELYAITSNRDGRASDGFPRKRDDVLVRIGRE